MFNKHNETSQRFAIKKYTFGVTSALVGVFFFTAANAAQAEEVKVETTAVTAKPVIETIAETTVAPKDVVSTQAPATTEATTTQAPVTTEATTTQAPATTEAPTTTEAPKAETTTVAKKEEASKAFTYTVEYRDQATNAVVKSEVKTSTEAKVQVTAAPVVTTTPENKPFYLAEGQATVRDILLNQEGQADGNTVVFYVSRQTAAATRTSKDGRQLEEGTGFRGAGVPVVGPAPAVAESTDTATNEKVGELVVNATGEILKDNSEAPQVRLTLNVKIPTGYYKAGDTIELKFENLFAGEDITKKSSLVSSDEKYVYATLKDAAGKTFDIEKVGTTSGTAKEVSESYKTSFEEKMAADIPVAAGNTVYTYVFNENVNNLTGMEFTLTLDGIGLDVPRVAEAKKLDGKIYVDGKEVLTLPYTIGPTDYKPKAGASTDFAVSQGGIIYVKNQQIDRIESTIAIQTGEHTLDKGDTFTITLNDDEFSKYIPAGPTTPFQIVPTSSPFVPNQNGVLIPTIGGELTTLQITKVEDNKLTIQVVEGTLVPNAGYRFYLNGNNPSKGAYRVFSDDTYNLVKAEVERLAPLPEPPNGVKTGSINSAAGGNTEAEGLTAADGTVNVNPKGGVAWAVWVTDGDGSPTLKSEGFERIFDAEVAMRFTDVLTGKEIRTGVIVVDVESPAFEEEAQRDRFTTKAPTRDLTDKLDPNAKTLLPTEIQKEGVNNATHSIYEAKAPYLVEGKDGHLYEFVGYGDATKYPNTKTETSGIIPRSPEVANVVAEYVKLAYGRVVLQFTDTQGNLFPIVVGTDGKAFTRYAIGNTHIGFNTQYNGTRNDALTNAVGQPYDVSATEALAPKTIESNGFTYRLVKTPDNLTGVLSADNVLVRYTYDVEQVAEIKFEVEGKDGAPATPLADQTVTEKGLKTEAISTTAYEAKLKELEAKGYEVVTDGFKDATADAKKFDANAAVNQEFKVVLREKVVNITDPKDPILPRDVQAELAKPGNELKEEVNQTVTYVKADGTEAATTKTDKVEFTRPVKVNLVTKAIEYGEWTPVNTDEKFDAKPTPVVTGFLATKVETEGQSTPATAEIAEVAKVNPTDTDAKHTHKVVYTPVSEYTFINPANTTQAPVKYVNHDTDPTKLADNQPVIPYEEGYTPKFNGQELPLVNANDPKQGYVAPTPTDATQPTQIEYVSDKQVANFKFVEKGTNKELGTAKAEGTSGTAIPTTNYQAELDRLTKQYVVVTDEFKDAAATNKNFDKDAKVEQNFTITLAPKIIEVPYEPLPADPDFPLPLDPTKVWNETVTRTVTYITKDAAGATTATEGPTEIDKVTFTKSAKVNLATGEVTEEKWIADNNDSTFNEFKVPVKTGYLANKATLAKIDGITPEQADVAETVEYTPIGKFVVELPDGSKVETPYKNHPEDPRFIDPIDKPEIPYVEGFVPGLVEVGPDGKPVLDENGKPKTTPLELVDLDDPKKGYIAPEAPINGTPDTIIKYVGNDQTATIVFKNEAGAVLATVTENGISEAPIKEEAYADKLKTLLNGGHVVVKDTFDGANKDHKFDTDPTKTQEFEVVLRERVIPLTPGAKPGEPVDAGNPDGPKWPDTIKDLLDKKEVVRTITYVNDKGETVSAKVDQKLGFHRAAVVNLVNLVTTVITQGEWVPDSKNTFDPVKSPVVKGYLADRAEVPVSEVIKGDTADITEVVNYKPIGGYVVTTPGGEKTVIPYTNDEENPTKVDENDKPTIPAVDGYVPTHNGTPLTPIKDDKGNVIGYEAPDAPENGTPDTPITYVPTDATKTTPTATEVVKREDVDKITEKDITDAVTVPGFTPDQVTVAVKDPATIPTTDEPGDKGKVTVVVTYPDGSKEEVEVPVRVTPNDATNTTPVVTEVVKREDVDKITEEDIKSAVTVPGFNPDQVTVTVKDPAKIPTTDEPGDKGTVTVVVTYPDGSTEEVEVPVKVTPNQATNNTPTPKPVEKVEDTPLKPEDFENVIPGLPEGTKVTVKDPDKIPTTENPGDKGTVTVIVEYPDGSTEEVEVPVKVTPNTATNTTPIVSTVEKTEDVEKITEEDIKNAIELPGVDRDKTTFTILDPLPTTDEPGFKGTVTVEITYPDGSKETVEVPVNVKPNLATTKDPFAIPVEKVEDTPLTEEDITNNIKGVPTGSTFEIKDPLPTTDEPGDKGTVTVEITYPDGSKEEIEVPVIVTPNDATKNVPTPKPVEVPVGTPITKDDITGGITGTPTGTTYEIVDPIPTTETPGDKGTVTVVVTYPDGSKEEVEVPVKVTPKPVTPTPVPPKPTDAEVYNPTPNTVEKVEDTPLTEEDITSAVPGLPAGTKVTVKDPSKIPTTENPGDKGTVTVVVTYPDGSTEEVEVPVKVTPKPVTTAKGTGIQNPEKPELVIPEPDKGAGTGVISTPSKPTTIYVDQDGNVLTPDANGNVPGYELVETKKDANGNTVHVYRKAAAKPAAKPAVKATAQKAAAKPAKKAAKAGALPKTSATGTETNSALPAGLAAALTAAGLLAARRRREEEK